MLSHKVRKPSALLIIGAVLLAIAWATWTFWLVPASETPAIPDATTPANPN